MKKEEELVEYDDDLKKRRGGEVDIEKGGREFCGIEWWYLFGCMLLWKKKIIFKYYYGL